MAISPVTNKKECITLAAEITKEYAKNPSVIVEDIEKCLDSTYKKLKDLLKDANA